MKKLLIAAALLIAVSACTGTRGTKKFAQMTICWVLFPFRNSSLPVANKIRKNQKSPGNGAFFLISGIKP